MIFLYGLREEAEYGYGGWTGNSETVRKLVATFDELQDAKDYVANSTLKAANDPYFYADPISGKFKYRKGSLLRNYESCEIDCEKEEIPPHNPK